jgi:hypothetical protein
MFVNPFSNSTCKKSSTHGSIENRHPNCPFGSIQSFNKKTGKESR